MRSIAPGIASALLGSIPAVLIAGSWSPAQAILNFDIYQDGSNVVVKASGTLSGLPGSIGGGTATCSSKINAEFAIVCTGPGTGSYVYNITGPSSIGSATVPPSPIFADSSSGISVYIDADGGVLGIDNNYISGQISSSATFLNKTLADLGLTSTLGTLGTWTINGSSPTESINVNIVNAPSASVPGPLPVLGAGAAFAWSRRLRSRIGSKAAAAVPQG